MVYHSTKVLTIKGVIPQFKYNLLLNAIYFDCVPVLSATLCIVLGPIHDQRDSTKQQLTRNHTGSFKPHFLLNHKKSDSRNGTQITALYLFPYQVKNRIDLASGANTVLLTRIRICYHLASTVT